MTHFLILLLLGMGMSLWVSHAFALEGSYHASGFLIQQTHKIQNEPGLEAEAKTQEKLLEQIQTWRKNCQKPDQNKKNILSQARSLGTQLSSTGELSLRWVLPYDFFFLNKNTEQPIPLQLSQDNREIVFGFNKNQKFTIPCQMQLSLEGTSIPFQIQWQKTLKNHQRFLPSTFNKEGKLLIDPNLLHAPLPQGTEKVSLLFLKK